MRGTGFGILAGAEIQAKTKPMIPSNATPPKATYTILDMTAPPLQYQGSYEQQCAKAEEKQEKGSDMLLAFAERSVEGRERDEESADFPHRVFDSLGRTLRLCRISHGTGDEFSRVNGSCCLRRKSRTRIPFVDLNTPSNAVGGDGIGYNMRRSPQRALKASTYLHRRDSPH